MTDSTLTFRPRTRDDDERLREIYLQTEDVFRLSLDEWRFHMDERAREPGKEPMMTVAEANGHIVGSSFVEPHYSGTDGVFFATVEIDEAEYSKGYGSAIWERTEATLRERSIVKAYHSIRADLTRSQRFAESKGFERTGRAERISRLNLHTANLEGYDGLDQQMRDQSIEIKKVNEVERDETFMRELHEAIMAMLRDIPRTEEEWTPIAFEVWRENFLRSPGSSPDAYWLALSNGHPVGLANLQITPGSKGVFNGLTGVVPDFRHKGIARALKYKTILWARENGYEYIDTANDAANARMLSINIPLGYDALPAREEWLKEYSAS